MSLCTINLRGLLLFILLTHVGFSDLEAMKRRKTEATEQSAEKKAKYEKKFKVISLMS